MRDFNDPYEDLEDGTEPSTFNVKYLGSTVIDAARSEDATAEAVKTVISTAKGQTALFDLQHCCIDKSISIYLWFFFCFCIVASGKKLQRVSLSVSPKGIEVHDPVSGETQQQVSVYRISYCSADATHDHVFAFVSSLDHRESTSSFGECSSSSSQSSDAPAILECHAFLCPKRKVAQEVALTVARSFGRAYEVRFSRENERPWADCTTFSLFFVLYAAMAGGKQETEIAGGAAFWSKSTSDGHWEQCREESTDWLW